MRSKRTVAELGRSLQPQHAPERERILVHVSGLLRSRTFANAPSLRRLLSYVVDRTLAGRADAVKEYSIGVEVFERRESFDPRTDTIVRVQARRLRAKLAEYYELEGRDDTIAVELPKGGYIPSFRSVAPFDASGPEAESMLAPRDLAQPNESPLVTIPVPRTSLIGRELELAHVRRLLLDSDSRLLTLTGAGGSGKTRLAQQAAFDLVAEFPGGVRFVELGSVTHVNDVGTMLAQAVGLRRIDGGTVADALREHVRSTIHERTLVVLDTFEHLLPAASLLVAMLESSPALTLLVTSRAVLHVSGEQCVHVPPLQVPDLSALPSIPVLAENAAVALFVRQAVAGQPSFVLTADNAAAVADICFRLDGLPLAIELAAARTRVLSPQQIRTRLESRFDLLTGGACDLPGRQQTLRKTIDWSYDLLTEPEKRFFRRLAVFGGSCTLEGAEAVCNVHHDLGLNPLDGMSSLVDKSLIRQVDTAQSELRFAMLDTVREYALEQLDASGERAVTQRAHAAYCIVLAEEGFAQLTASGRAEWVARCQREHENYRVALDHLIGSGDSAWAVRLGQALFEYWDLGEHRLEGHDRLNAILSLPDMAAPSKARATALAFASLLAPLPEARQNAEEALSIYRSLSDLRGVVVQLNNLGVNRRLRGDSVGARYWLEEAVQTHRELGDRAALATALSNLADVQRRLGDTARARTSLLEAQELFREVGHSVGQAWSMNHLGDLARASGHPAEARRHYQDGAAVFRSLGDQLGIARSEIDLGHLACEEGDLAAAHTLFTNALNRFSSSDHKLGIAIALEAFACTALRQEQHDRAFTLAGAASSVRRTIGSAAVDAREKQSWHDGTLASMRKNESARARSMWMLGAKLPIRSAVDYALSGDPRAIGNH